MREIIKKAYSKYFEEVLSGEKKFEIRLNDFDADIGDIIILKEINDKREFTGREIKKKITYVSKTKNVDWWSEEDIKEKGFIVMSLANIK